MKAKKNASIVEDPSSDNQKLPEEWKLAELGSVAKYINGMAFKPTDWEKSGRPIIRIQNLTKSTNVVNRLSKEVDKKFIVKDGDLLISWSATLGAYIYSGEEAVLNQHIFRVEPFIEIIDKKFLFYSVNFHIKQLERDAHGSGMVHITKGFFNNITISLPPLAEQKRIVARVEALLKQVNVARDRLSRVPLIMKKFRQGVLAAACSGRLTEGWREENPNIELAIELLQKIKPEVRGKKINAKQATNDFFDFDQFELPNTWTWTTTSDICTEISDGDHYPPSKFPSGVPFIVISNISSGTIDFTKTMFASQKYYDELAINRKPQFGDVLYTVTGSYGIPVIVDTHKEFCFQRHIALLRPHPIIPSEFLWILMKSEMVYQQSTSIATGIAQLTVPLAGLRVLKVPLPPLAEQHEIVRRVGALFERADAIDREIVAAGRRCERLTQAVLARGFKGELIGKMESPNEIK
jgi:type I restriction enzyme S subunit